MNANKERERIQALFSDLEKLAGNLPDNNPQFQQELETLRARVSELEARFVQNEPDPQNRESNTDSGMGSSQNTNQSLYEKDQIGYGYSNDRLEALQALSLPTPEHKNTYTAHFTVGKEAIGEMQVEPRDNQEFTNDQTSLVNAVVQQASLQIQNLRLLSATNRARAEAEFATRRFMHEGWESYLDAI